MGKQKKPNSLAALFIIMRMFLRVYQRETTPFLVICAIATPQGKANQEIEPTERVNKE